MNLENINAVLKGEPKYRIDQVNKIIYKDALPDWNKATVLPSQLKIKLEREAALRINEDFYKSQEDETVKALITLEDGLQIETVLMRSKNSRNTVCISSQVGCPLACTFCATGKMGFKRNLSVSEIVEQVILFERYLKESKQKITNVVFMGMGEPFLNYENVILAIKILNDPGKFNLGARRISVSTAGIPSFIKKFAIDAPECNLAISLHAANSPLRSSLMPINNAYGLNEVMEAVDYYLAVTNRKVMLEYILIGGVNDSLEDVSDLAKLTKNRLVHVNLIPYNPTGTYKTASRETSDRFRSNLKQLGVSVTQRFRFGTDINAACGQLALKNKKL